MRIIRPTESIQPFLPVIEAGIPVVQKMMIAQEPGESCIVAHHASQIEEKDNEQPVHGGVGQPQSRDHRTQTLKRTLDPMAVVGIQDSRFLIFMMNPVIEIECARVQKSMGYVEPNIVAQNCCCDV